MRYDRIDMLAVRRYRFATREIGGIVAGIVLTNELRENPRYQQLSKEYQRHLGGCDQCNYDKECMHCETGDPQADAYADWTSHACNCPHGPGEGAFYRREMRELSEKVNHNLPDNVKAREEAAEQRRREVRNQLAIEWLFPGEQEDVSTARFIANINLMVNKIETLYGTGPAATLDWDD